MDELKISPLLSIASIAKGVGVPIYLVNNHKGKVEISKDARESYEHEK